MTAFYLYAITDRPEAPVPAQPGLEEATLWGIAYQDIVAIGSPFTAAAAAPTEANLWQHEAVVESLIADRAVLPVRFGAIFASETAVRAVLAAHYTNFLTSLDRVRGRVELGLRILWDDDLQRAESGLQIADSKHQPSTTSHQLSTITGRSYMLARLEEERQFRAWRERAETLAMELNTSLSRLAAESVQQRLITPRLLLTAAYLVEQDQVVAFRLEVEALKATHPALHFLCTGPWPPYSFVAATVPMVGV
jgi:hypothetical protein